MFYSLLVPGTPDKTTKQPQTNKWRKAAGKAKLGKGKKNFFGKMRANSVIVLSGEDSEDSHVNNDQAGEKIEEEKSSVTSGWTEHVWSTFIDRGFSDDVTENEEKIQGKHLISHFQQQKFRHFFYHVLDLNSDHVISAEDFDGLNDRVRHYMAWSVNTLYYLALKEVHFLFLEFFLLSATEIAKEESFDYCDPFKTVGEESEPASKSSVTIDEWVDVWGEVVGKAKKLDDLPMWLQYYPKTLFDTINRSSSGVITKTELKLFYTAFLDAGRLGEVKLMELTEKSYNAMTANGDVELSYHIYKLSFLNFLLGKQPNGPGQFMFGLVEQGVGADQLFPIDYSATHVDEGDTLILADDIESERVNGTLDEEEFDETASRKSVFV